MIYALIISILVGGCAMRMYGHMSCDGKCELVIDRTVEEADTNPLPDVPTIDATVKGK